MSVDQSDIPLCDALALKPPYTETRSLRSTVSGTSIPKLWLDGDDGAGSRGSVGKFVSVESVCSVAIAEESDGLLKPIDSVLAGTVA